MENTIEYWKKRCELAEEYIHQIPCGPDITKDQIKAFNEWNEFIVSEKRKQKEFEERVKIYEIEHKERKSAVVISI
jgi:hypothetical protein